MSERLKNSLKILKILFEASTSIQSSGYTQLQRVTVLADSFNSFIFFVLCDTYFRTHDDVTFNVQIVL